MKINNYLPIMSADKRNNELYNMSNEITRKQLYADNVAQGLKQTSSEDLKIELAFYRQKILGF